ncbi:MAG: response regulator [Clostridia bacterium]|nr:response regulator [Clostridia bacterium]
MENVLITWISFGVFCALALAALIVIAKALKEQKRARAVISAFADGREEALIILNGITKVPVYISDSVKTLFGLDRDTVDSDICSLEWCADADECKQFYSNYKNWDRKKEYTSEFRFKNIDTEKWHNGRLCIFEYQKDFLIIRISEISKEIAIRDELKNELERVKTEEQHKSDFLSKMSHEIRTPMNGILGMLSLAKLNISDAEQVMTYLDKADNLSQFMLSLINDILDMSKIESGKVVLEHAKFDFLEIFDKLHEMFAGTMEQKGIVFEMKREDMDVRYVIGDSLRLLQILINFLSNASKYTFKGGTVTITFRQMNKVDGKVHMLFKVGDTGKGMDPQFLSRIFKPFEQESASTTRKFGGTGLGMAIADNLVRLMGGHIVVDTALGKGSEFSVYIPFDIAEGDQSFETSGTSESAADGKYSIEGLRILMAEDNAINAEIAVEILTTMEGAEVETASDGVEAVDMFKNSEDGYYDVILMDIQMPRLDGWTAAQTIRAIDSDYARTIPIFALSANAYVEDKRHSVEIGMNGHISKPIDFDELKKLIHETLNKLKIK